MISRKIHLEILKLNFDTMLHMDQGVLKKLQIFRHVAGNSNMHITPWKSSNFGHIGSQTGVSSLEPLKIPSLTKVSIGHVTRKSALHISCVRENVQV